MKKYLKFHLYLALFGIVAGIFIWLYFLVDPVDPNEYKYYAFYINYNNKMEQTMLAFKKDDTQYLINYYEEEKNNDKALIKQGDFWIIPRFAKIKILDTLDGKIIKVRVLYNTKNQTKNRKDGYVPVFTLHDSLLYEIE